MEDVAVLKVAAKVLAAASSCEEGDKDAVVTTCEKTACDAVVRG